jgi:hypothetical protein
LLRFALIALALCAGLLVCLMLLPGWLSFMPAAQLAANAARYDDVIRMIQAGAISSGSLNGERVTLPPAYRDLSPGGDGQVLIYRNGTSLRVWFYLSGISPFTTQVYLYSSGEVSPGDFQGECSEITPERLHWYRLHCP